MLHTHGPLILALRKVVTAVFGCAFGARVDDQLWTWLVRQPIDGGGKLPRSGRRGECGP